MKSQELLAAYRATTYRIFLPEITLELRLDQAHAGLQAWMRETENDCFAIVTAYNPASQEISATENAERQWQLASDLLEAGYVSHAGENIADDGSWPVEETCFVAGISAEDASLLGADYGQHAVIVGSGDGVPRLLWIEED